MIRAHYNEDGQILGFYDPAITPVVPAPSVEVARDDWLAHVEHRAILTINDGVPILGTLPELSPEEKAAQRIALVKAECRRRIYVEASAETQMNMVSAVAVISGKLVADRSAVELAIFEGAEAANAWVAEMRAKAAELAADPEADYEAEGQWPPLPNVASAMLESF